MDKSNVKCLNCIVEENPENSGETSKEAFDEYLKQKKEEDSIFTERNKKFNKS